MYNRITKLLFLFFFALSLNAQEGTLRGTIVDDATGETIPFANVIVGELIDGIGTTSDLDGKYSINLPAGTYAVKFTFIGFSDLIVNDIIIDANKVNLLDIRMKEEGQVLEQVVVTAKSIRNTEAALATIKKKSTNLLDGISSQTFQKIGDGDAGEAIKRVTGVSVEGGKHVYVRGLGDRYTKTIVNGLDIPGLDPDRNSFEMDLFPTNLIDNILVYKSFSPDLPADFTGGVVDIVTKDFPDQLTFNVSASLSYNPDMHFNSNFLTYEGGGRDWLGMDDGSRELPIGQRTEIPNPALGMSATTTFTTEFSNVLATMRNNNNLNSSLGISTGNQITAGKATIGYSAAINYKNSTSFYENAEFNTFIFDEQNFPGEYRLINDTDILGDLGTNNVLWSAMAGTSIKYKNHKISLNAFRIQNGTSSAARQTEAKSQTSSALLLKDVLEYQQRSVNNISLKGKHTFGDEGDFIIDWKASPSFIEVDEPDLRRTAFERLPDGTTRLAPAVGADASRTWRNLQETAYSGKIDFTYKLKIGERDSKIKFGGLTTLKERDFRINNYIVRVLNQTELGLNADPDRIFATENIWTPFNNQGTYIRGQFEPANTFNATQSIYSAYVMNELPLGSKLKAIYGIRMEKAQNKYTGVSNDGITEINDSTVLDELNLLPSLNLVYEATEGMNIRFSYNKTLARPSFKEKSIAQIQDRITGRTFIGNLDLLQTEIDNLDLRWEYFGTRGQLVSVSGFYKRFINPIELVPFSNAAPNNFTPRNLEQGADVYGVEFEFSKKLGMLGNSFQNFTLGSNITLVKSVVERTTLITEGETERPMFGQSPYIINASLGYNNIENGIEFNTGFNVQGKRLVVVGAGSSADVYERPFNSLNAKVGKKFSNGLKVSFSLENLLNAQRRKEYEAYSGDIGIFELLNPGRTFSLGASWSL